MSIRLNYQYLDSTSWESPFNSELASYNLCILIFMPVFVWYLVVSEPQYGSAQSKLMYWTIKSRDKSRATLFAII